MAQMEHYVKCREELLKFIDENNCAPIMVRLAWHDSGNFDKRISSWPECGGANGSIIHEPEISYGANAGLTKAVNFLKPFKQKICRSQLGGSHPNGQCMRHSSHWWPHSAHEVWPCGC